ncbi:MAG: 4-hydroxy-tetrahydrodipicolinate reductase [Promethearchaeota archaeon]
MIKLLILGAAGAMGRLIAKQALEDDDIEVVSACDVMNIGQELGKFAGTEDPNNIKISGAGILSKVIEETKPEVAVDFSIAKATEKNCPICIENNVKCVIGTTMLSQEFVDKLEKMIKEYKIPVVMSSNMATGVNILFKIASILTAYLSDWDIEILEAHHHRKVDAPSGTALTIGQIICETLGVNPEEILKFGRSKGPNKREIGAKKEIGVHSIRGGDIVGDHTILFAGPGERIELKHQAHSRNSFASGAIKAIKFIAEAKDPKIYTISDVLGL